MGLKLLISSRKMDFGIMSSKAPKTQMSIIPHKFGDFFCQSADSAVVSPIHPAEAAPHPTSCHHYITT